MTDSLATLRKALGAQYHIERELGGGTASSRTSEAEFAHMPIGNHAARRQVGFRGAAERDLRPAMAAIENLRR